MASGRNWERWLKDFFFLLKIALHFTNWNIYKLQKNLKYLQQDKTRESTLLTYYEECKVNMIVNNNDKNNANNLFNMIFIQIKKTKHDLYISNKKLHLTWNK